MNNSRISFVVLTLSLLGCTETLEGDIRLFQPQYTIAGRLVAGSEPSTVTLKGFPFGTEVQAVSAGGQRYPFTLIDREGSTFKYQGDFGEIQPQVGERYQLAVVFGDIEVQSEFMEIPPPPSVLSADVVPEWVSFRDDNNVVIRRLYNTIVQTMENRNEAIFLYSEATAYLERTIDINGDCPPRVNSCWETGPVLGSVVIGNNQNRGDATFDFFGFRILAESNGEMSVRLVTHAVSEQEFEFLDRVRAQEERVNSIFQSPIPRLSGNLRSTGTEEIEVVGFFGVSSARVDSICYSQRISRESLQFCLICEEAGTPCNQTCIDFLGKAVTNDPGICR